jgi:hypothetical protein
MIQKMMWCFEKSIDDLKTDAIIFNSLMIF